MTEVLRRFALPFLGLWAVGVVTLTIGFLTADEQLTPPQASEVAPADAIVRGVVQQISSDQITLTTPSGSVTVRLAPSSVIEALRPATSAELRPGDWLNAGATPHNQTQFAIIGLVIIPAGQLQ